jgi:cell wall-associated NlpC family hydrolase
MLVGASATGRALAADCSGAAIAPALQTPGRSAAGVVTIGNRIVLIDDAGAAKQLLVCEIEGSGFVLKERIELPADIAVEKIEAEGSTITLTTADGQRIEKKIAAPPTGPAEAVPPEGYRFSASRKAEKKFVLKVAPSASPGARMAPGPAIEIELSPIVPGAQIYTRKILNVDPSRNAATVFWDEVGTYGTRAFIATFADGRMTAGAQIPLNEIETIPENFAGVLADGRAYYLRTNEGKTVPVILELDAGFADKAKASGPLIEQFKRERAPDQPEKRSERIKQGIKKLAERALPSRAAPASAGDDEAAFQALVRAATGEGSPPAARAAPPPQVKRAEVIKCAEEFRDLLWTLTPTSYQKPGVANDCSPQAKYWRRPHYLNGKSGKEVKGVPYCWGCSHSLDKFLNYVKTGERLAGQSCTCRTGHYCIRNDSTGVDCSGFVSQCWKAVYHTTSSMGEISTVISKADLKPGDALNRAGNHIRLFMNLVETDTGPRFRMIEATNAEGRIGRVIEATYTASELSSYKAIRYNKIVD